MIHRRDECTPTIGRRHLSPTRSAWQAWGLIPEPLSRLAVYLIPLALACNAPARTSATDSTRASGAWSAAARTAASDSVRALLADFLTKMNAADYDALGRLYSDDSTFSWVENGALRYPRARDVRESLKSLRTIPKIEVKYFATEIDVLAPGVASVRTEFAQTFYDKQQHGTTYGGFLTATVVHEADGWKFRNGHTSQRKARPE